MISIILLFSLQTPFSLQFDIEGFFSESKCIQEPFDGFQTQYLSSYSSEEVLGNNEEFLNYRSEINKLVQYYDIEHSYELVEEEGASHQKNFNITLKLGDEIYHGVGRNKKDAKEMAAEAAIKGTNYKKLPVKVNDKDRNENDPPTVVLNNLGARHGYQIDYYILDPKLSTVRIVNLNKVKEKSILTNSTIWKESAHLDQPPKGPFSVEVTVNENSFFGKGTTIRSAKHDAASNALKTLQELGMAEESACTREGSGADCKEMKKKIKPTLSVINEYAQKTRLNLEFNELGKTGPPHKPVFEFECVLGEWTTTAEGRSKKEAKRNAAKEMLNIIPDLERVQDEIWEESSKKSNEKQSKKRKKSKKRTTFQMAEELVANVVDYFRPEVEPSNGDLKPETKHHKKQKDKYGNNWSPKEKLLETGKSLKINMQFQSSPRETSGFRSLLSLDLNPKYICLGTGANQKISEEHSALNGLKFLLELNLLEGLKQEDLEIRNFSFDNYIWMARDEETLSPKR